MPSLGPAEILVILVVALLVFGPDKMPEIAKQVGKGFREFRRVQQHLKSELRDVVAEFDAANPTAAVEQQAVPMLPPKDDIAIEPPPTTALLPSTEPASPSTEPASPRTEPASPRTEPASPRTEPDAPGAPGAPA